MISPLAFLVISILIEGSALAQSSPPDTISVGEIKTEFVKDQGDPFILQVSDTSSSLELSVALCSQQLPAPLFFVRAGNDTTDYGVDEAGDQLFLYSGVATIGGTGPAVFFAYPANGTTGNQSFQVSLYDDGGSFGATDPALLGDATSSQAIIFSPPFEPAAFDDPTYPNYTLPSANLSAPSPLSSPPNQTLYVFETTSDLSNILSSFSSSICIINGLQGNILADNKTIASAKSLVLKNSKGWREQWLIEGLKASTNYTVIVTSGATTVSVPMYFQTQADSFPCPLVHSLPFCPSVSYAVPLPTPLDQSTYTASNIPSNVTETLFSHLGNFTASLLTFACGRDVYSPFQSCASCQRAYRNWLCQITFPRCGSPLPSSLDPAPALLPHFAATPMSPPPRNPGLPYFNKNYTELLPCSETCFEVARACPALMAWQCPVLHVNANQSYGVGYIDSNAGKQNLGDPGYAQDNFGNVWCNYP